MVPTTEISHGIWMQMPQICCCLSNVSVLPNAQILKSFLFIQHCST
uniref:Uncharacterized protein n=1 Tax=Anguilla anguilla TaxID=7936 RepID=A0A0E9R748_ANGAN